MKWNVFYDNDESSCGEGFWEWWDVMDTDNQYFGKPTRVFKCHNEEDAVFLAEILNSFKEIKTPCSD